jgi:hypothetical protein
VVEAAEERCSRSRALHRELWVPESVGRRMRGSAHNGMRLEETIGVAVQQCSRAEMQQEEEERSSMEEWEWLLKHRVLEMVALGKHSRAHRDEERVKQLRLESAVAE